MKRIIRFIYYLIYFAAILVLWIMPVNKYEWMQEMDDTIKKVPEDSSGDISVAMAIIVGILIVLSLIRFKFAKDRREKLILIVLAFLAITVWLLK